MVSVGALASPLVRSYRSFIYSARNWETRSFKTWRKLTQLMVLGKKLNSYFLVSGATSKLLYQCVIWLIMMLLQTTLKFGSSDHFIETAASFYRDRPYSSSSYCTLRHWRGWMARMTNEASQPCWSGLYAFVTVWLAMMFLDTPQNPTQVLALVLCWENRDTVGLILG